MRQWPRKAAEVRETTREADERGCSGYAAAKRLPNEPHPRERLHRTAERKASAVHAAAEQAAAV